MNNEQPQLIVADAAAWRTWLALHHADSNGVWLILAKKGTVEPTSLGYDQALDEALCQGWIDGQVRRRDETTYQQRFTPRRARSPWSRRNVGIVARLVAEGRMQAAGLAEVTRAKRDGRWEAAYAAPGTSRYQPISAWRLLPSPRRGQCSTSSPSRTATSFCTESTMQAQPNAGTTHRAVCRHACQRRDDVPAETRAGRPSGPHIDATRRAIAGIWVKHADQPRLSRVTRSRGLLLDVMTAGCTAERGPGGAQIVGGDHQSNAAESRVSEVDVDMGGSEPAMPPPGDVGRQVVQLLGALGLKK